MTEQRSYHNTSSLWIRGLVAIATCMVIMTACDSEKPSHIEPHLTTLAATDITRNEATLNGMATIEGDTDMPQLCFKYGTSQSMDQTTPTLSVQDTHVSIQLSGLKAGNTYYYMLQGYNGRTTTNGNIMSFETVSNDIPSLGKTNVLSHGPMSLIVGYEIDNNGGEDITETGCYIAPTDGTSPQKVALTTYDGSTGMQKLSLYSLQPNTSYSITPYAINKIGEAKGEAITFTTTQAISLGEAGQLHQLLGDDIYHYTTIILAGPLNGDDLSCLRTMAGKNADDTESQGKLSSIDMTDAHIVAGGGPYAASRYTQDNVIGQGLFANCPSLTNIVLPATATTLEKNAFEGCTSLREIEIPSAVCQVLPSSGCTSLQAITVSAANSNFKSQDGVLLNGNGTEIVWFPMGKQGEYTLPSSVTSIADYAFKECSITKFVFPANLKEIGKGAFINSQVKEVVLPTNLKTIPTSCFQGCQQLTTVRIGSKAEQVGSYAFDYCPLSDLYIEAPTPPFCQTNALSSHGKSFTTTCILHVPTGKKLIYRNNNNWKVFTHIVEM